ncbi:MAG: methyltransferase, partial [Deltaproteobacteria bacterium]|nr:methyltransferase [Deltaproteobacteria bacterium]
VHSPSYHGFRVWPSSWLLIDFFKHRGLPYGTRVMEVGCGWGSAGIYCAKAHGAIVTAVDIDPEIFPYLRLHTEINEVKIATMRKGFDELTNKHFEHVDVMIGADICFWDGMVDPLKRLIHRALLGGVRLVVIADPGRPTFCELAEDFVEKRGGEILDWAVKRPHYIQGQILKICPLSSPELTSPKYGKTKNAAMGCCVPV